MRKALVTGSSSSYLPKTGKTTFTGLVADSMSGNVTWTSPKGLFTKKQIQEYDHIVVGISAPTSVSSYWIHGTLALIEAAEKAGNLTIVIDQQEPRKVWSSLVSVANNPEILYKDFFSLRPDRDVMSKDRIQRVVQSIAEKTIDADFIAPRYVWGSDNMDQYGVPDLNVSFIVPDGLIDLTDLICPPGANALSHWLCVDKSSSWIKNTSKILETEVHHLTYKNDSEMLRKLSESSGLLSPIYEKSQPWWSTDVFYSLYANTPVVTDWSLTAYLGSSWGYLPVQVEAMSALERDKLARSQVESYVNAVRTYDAVTDIRSSIRMKGK